MQIQPCARRSSYQTHAENVSGSSKIRKGFTVSLNMIGPVLTSMAAPLSATVIGRASSVIPGQRGTTLAMTDHKRKLEVKNFSKSELEALTKAGRDTSASGPEHSAKLNAANAAIQSQQIFVSPTFKLVFLTAVALTVLSGTIAVLTAFFANGVQPNQQAVFESMNTAWKLGLGAIFGLLGGKAA
jgi:hypothetical protein